VPSNLSAELSTFVGRVDDLERGGRLFGESRLVTLAGAGGCGKTRLARLHQLRIQCVVLPVATARSPAMDQHVQETVPGIDRAGHGSV
jgi:hypothetical protein